MVDITSKITINRSVEEVATFAANPDNTQKWYVNIKSVVWRTPRPVQIGSKIDFRAHFMGKELSYTYEIVDLVPLERLVMQTAEGPFPMQTTYTWSKIGEGQTLMSLRNTGKPTGFSRILTPFMKLMMRKANRHDLKKLKQIMESE